MFYGLSHGPVARARTNECHYAMHEMYEFIDSLSVDTADGLRGVLGAKNDIDESALAVSWRRGMGACPRRWKWVLRT